MPRRFPIGYSADARILLASYFSGDPATIKEILSTLKTLGEPAGGIEHSIY
jgi:hypothetical protein